VSCSSKCQAEHWKEHRKECKSLKAGAPPKQFKKEVKFLRKLPIDTQKVMIFVEYMMSVRLILEDVLDCAARGLPPPPDSKIYPMEADYCNDSMVNFEDWNRKSSIFKM
jgi:hypothetical protein